MLMDLLDIARKLKTKPSVICLLVPIVLIFASFATLKPWLSVFDAKTATYRRPAVAPHVVKPTFIYLIQTEECLAQYHLQAEILGQPSLCSCEVFVLSYKSPCWKNNHSHIHYTFENTSWSHGRNKLYKLVKEKNFEHVLYYIFLDDDIRLQYTSYAPEALKTRLPARVFEEWLLEHKPAVGTPNYGGGWDGGRSWKAKRNSVCGKKLVQHKDPRLLTLVHFDAAYDAIHRNAVDHILPYLTYFEDTNWWHSQKYVMVACELTFRGHVVMFMPIMSINQKHRPYTRYNADKEKAYSYFVEQVVKRVPQKYRETKFVKDLQANACQKIERSTSLCLALPPKHPIEPFAHFTWNLTGMIPGV